MKTKEELKLQLGEVLPNAIQLMSLAAQDAGLTIDGTVKSMMALQQKGGLISSKVLPHFAKRMSDAAKANGGLEAALNSNRVAMNQMVTSAQVAADTVFKSGWSEGLTDLFKATGDMLMENETLFISIGKIVGKVFKGIAWTIRNIVNPAFSALGSILNMVTDSMENFGDWVVLAFLPLVKFTPVLGTAIKYLGGMRAALMALSTLGFKVLLPFTLLVGALEEVAEFFSPTGKRTLIGANINDVTANLPSFMQPEGASKGEAGTGFDFMSKMSGLFVGGTGLTSAIKQSREQPKIVVNSDVYLDNEKVGKMVMGSEASISSMDGRIADYGAINY